MQAAGVVIALPSPEAAQARQAAWQAPVREARSYEKMRCIRRGKSSRPKRSEAG
jgi:hypothetical protein